MECSFTKFQYAKVQYQYNSKSEVWTSQYFIFWWSTITKVKQIMKPKKSEIQAIAIAIKLLGFWQKEGQYIVPNSIVDK